jgi:hypothetical protein
MSDNLNKQKYRKIEPFFDAIINAIKKILATILKAVLSPIINILKKLAKIIVDFVADKVLKPIFNPIGEFLVLLVSPLKPLFAFIGKMLDFIVLIAKFFLKVLDMILSLPFKIMENLGLIQKVDGKEAIDRISDSIGNVNSSFVDTANSVPQVVNKPNTKIFLTIVVLSIIFISIYYFYDSFTPIFDETYKMINGFFYPKVVEE